MDLQKRFPGAFKISVAKELKLLILLAFLSGSVSFAFFVPDTAKLKLFDFISSDTGVGTAAVCGCVFLYIAVYASSVSLAGGLGVPLLNLVCGAFVSAVSGAIIPDAVYRKDPLFIALISLLAYLYITVFLFISMRSVALSRELAERVSPDKRFKRHFFALTALMLFSAVILLLSFLILSGFIPI